MRNILDETTGLVGHYTSLRTACEFILSERRIRCSPVREMNDPRENKARSIFVGWTDSDDEPNHSEIESKADECFRDYSKVFCGTLDSGPSPVPKTQKCFGRPRMWAQYGENHRGVCLVFDKEGLDTMFRSHVGEDDLLFSQKMRYESDGSMNLGQGDIDYNRIQATNLESALQEHVKLHHESLFFRKDSDWSGETEYRWVIHRWESGYEHVDLGDSLKAVVLGVDCPEVYRPAIKGVASDIPIYHLRWDDQYEDFAYSLLESEGNWEARCFLVRD